MARMIDIKYLNYMIIIIY